VLTLNATVKDAPYYKRKMWVDKELFIQRQEEMYAKKRHAAQGVACA